MPRFLNQVTQLLNNVFRFEGTLQSLSRIDLSGDIQPVFDLSRSAALARAADFGTSQGLVGLTLTNSHVGSGELISSALDLSGVEAAFFNVPPDSINVWIMDISAQIDVAANLTNIQATLQDRTIQGSALSANAGRLLWLGDTSTGLSGGTTAGRDPLFLAGGPSHRVMMPYLMTPGSGFVVTSLATGACTPTVFFRLWVGPRFSSPPGA